MEKRLLDSVTMKRPNEKKTVNEKGTMIWESIHQRMPDGTILLLRRFAFPAKKHSSVGVLFLPNPLAHASDQGVVFACAEMLPDKQTTSYVLQPRGTGGSEGFWSLASHRADILDWLGALRKIHKKMIVVAEGLSANILLELEEESHHRNEKRRFLPDGMVLFDPVREGDSLAPAGTLLRRISSFAPHFSAKMRTKKGTAIGTAHLGHARIRAREAHAVLSKLDAFRLSPVRLQTHTVLFLSKDHDRIGKMLFGNVRISHHFGAIEPDQHMTFPQMLLRAKEINAQVLELADRESPIRFYS